MPALILKLIATVWSAIATHPRPTPKAPPAGRPSPQTPGAVISPPIRQPKNNTTTVQQACEWSIVVDDPLTGEPRGLVFHSEALSQAEALEYAQAILTTARLHGLFIAPYGAQHGTTTGLYLFTYHLGRCQKLGCIWATSLQDASDAMGNMAESGSLLCYVGPDSSG